jgi:hypothetical protein
MERLTLLVDNGPMRGVVRDWGENRRGNLGRRCTVGNKDKGGKPGKKTASKSLKEKRQAKKEKRAG